MIDVVLTIAFLVLAIRTAQGVSRESAIFTEFNQPRSLQTLVFLYPAAPLLLIVLSLRLGWLIAILAAAACYVPALVAARKNLQAFDRAGTDRVTRAKSLASSVVGAGIAGLSYCGVVLAYRLVTFFGADTTFD